MVVTLKPTLQFLLETDISLNAAIQEYVSLNTTLYIYTTRSGSLFTCDGDIDGHRIRIISQFQGIQMRRLYLYAAFGEVDSYKFYKLTFGHSGTEDAKTFGWFWGARNGAAFRIEAHQCMAGRS